MISINMLLVMLETLVLWKGEADCKQQQIIGSLIPFVLRV